MKIGSKRAAPVAMLACALFTATCSGSAMGAHGQRSSLLRRVAVVDEATSSEKGAAPAPSLHWVHARLPAGGSLEYGAVVHAVRKGETWLSIAAAYLDLTSVYDQTELARAIVRSNPEAKHGPTPGLHVRIPHILDHAPKQGAGERLGMPKDGIVKGIYVRGSTAGGHGYPALLDRVVSHGMNAIVLDVKDSDGLLTYASEVPLAKESGAVHDPAIRSYARAIRFAHERGVRVIARISCFSDQLMSKAHPGMAIRGVSGHVYHNGWLDPQSERAQEYALDLAKESIAAGADEIELDYVRFPVIGMKNIDFGLDKTDRTAKVDVITRFVSRVHAVTRSHGVALSLDVFGVIAFGKRIDMENLGQDPAELAKHAEFLSPMVYPSHFDPGFMGMDEPGNHPELVGLGVKHMLAHMEEQGLRADAPGTAKIRPWLQAMRHKSSNYGAGYIQEEIRTGDHAGGAGWLLWNPGQAYEVAWSATPKLHDARDQHLKLAKLTR